VIPPEPAEIIPTLIPTVSTPVLMPEVDTTAVPVDEFFDEAQPEPTNVQMLAKSQNRACLQDLC